MKKRFNINLLMSFLSKKGALLLGLFAGAMIVLLSSIVVNAEELKESDKDSSSGAVVTSTCLYAKSSTNTYAYEFNIYVDKDSDYLSNMCCLETAGSTVNGNPCVTVTLMSNYTMSGTVVRDGVTSDFSSTSISTDTSVQTYSCLVYRFATLTECQQYLAGELDASCALNYDFIQAQSRSWGYDGTYPYYDNATMSINMDSSATYNGKMSTEMQAKFLNLTQKTSDGVGGNYVPYLEYYAVALYCDTERINAINELFLKYGTDFSKDNALIPSDFDDIITFDENGHLNVSTMYLKTADKDGKGNNAVTINANSPLLAVCIEGIHPSDKQRATVSFSKNLSADKNITKGYFDNFSNIVGTGVPQYDSYVLIGYAVNTRITIVQNNNYVHSQDAYSYVWVSNALNERYGSMTTIFNNDNQSTGGVIFDSNTGSIENELSGTVDMDSINDYVKNGFGLLGNDGYLTLLQVTFMGVPAYIWAIVACALSLNCLGILFKILRGM